MLLTESLLGSSSSVAANYIEDVFSTYLYTGNGATQSIPNSIQLGSGATTAGWIATLGGSSSNIGMSTAVDGSGNVYVFGYSTASGNNDFLLAKYNSAGTLQWQRTLTTSGSNSEIGQSVAVDSSGNIYICGYSDFGGANYLQLAKYDTSGVIQWQRWLGGADNIGHSVAVDSSGNVYACGYTNVSGSNDALLVKYDSSGTIQWQRRLGSAASDEAYSIAVDSSGNVYICGRSSNTGDNDFLIAKYNTSGTIQWQRRLGDASFSQIANSISVDSSGNVYVCGYSDSSGAPKIQIAKYNTSGVIQWQRDLGSAATTSGNSIAVDSSSNVYVLGYTSAGGSNDFLIAKYNTSGTIQWQRTLGSSSNDFGRSIAVDASGNIYVCGYSNPSGINSFLLAKLPNDGTGTGGYSVGGYIYTYQVSTLTDATTSLTDAATTFTGATTTLTNTTSTLTDSASTLSSSSTVIPSGAGYGGLVWNKQRNGTFLHCLTDTARGVGNSLDSADTAANDYSLTRISAFNANGFTMGGNSRTNASGYTYTSWTFRKQAKFFDIVTWTGNGAAIRSISHNLQSTPNCLIVKRTDAVSDWRVMHYSAANNYLSRLILNSTAAGANGFPGAGVNPFATDTTFDVGSSTYIDYNVNGATYVAYLFAHNAGGFGASGSDNVISCGSYTGNGGTQTVTLGYEPQWVLVKNSDGGASGIANWVIVDNMRGMPVGSNDSVLYPNLTDAEASTQRIAPTATGFTIGSASGNLNDNGAAYIYIAIRRGPMKTPTSGTSVFSPVVYSGTGTSGLKIGTSIPVDMTIIGNRNSTQAYNHNFADRLRGPLSMMRSPSASAEQTTANWVQSFAFMDGVNLYTDASVNQSGTNNHIAHAFRRAPGFFDVVCYTGTGSATTVNHNLGVAPELMIVKRRDSSTAGDWWTYVSSLGGTKYLRLNSTDSEASFTLWNNTSPTSSVFTIGTYQGVNNSGSTYVAYLFATVTGVSKVGSYTGSGTTKQIDCGFTGGARFVLIKRTDSTGDWYLWDSARGIVAGNDPYLLLNDTAADVTSTDYVDTYSAGFEISSTAPAAINANGGSFIFLAIA